MGIPPKIEVPKTKVRWLININAHKIGDIEEVSNGRLRNLLTDGMVELYPPKAKVEVKVAPKVEVAVAEPKVEAAVVEPVPQRGRPRKHPLSKAE